MTTEPKAKAIPEADPDSQEDQLAAGATIPPHPGATDAPVGPQDDAWRHPEPADEPKGYREATEKQTEALNALTPKAQEPMTEADLRKAEDPHK